MSPAIYPIIIRREVASAIPPGAIVWSWAQEYDVAGDAPFDPENGIGEKDGNWAEVKAAGGGLSSLTLTVPRTSLPVAGTRTGVAHYLTQPGAGGASSFPGNEDLLDDFNRTSGSAISGSTSGTGHIWGSDAIQGGAGGMLTVGNELAPQFSQNGYLLDTFTDPCHFTIDVADPPTGGYFAFWLLKQAGTSGFDGYVMIYVQGAGWRVGIVNNGSITWFSGLIAGNELVVGDKIGWSLEAGSIAARRYDSGNDNWITITAQEDPTYTGDFQLGIEGQNGAYDNLMGGNVSLDAGETFQLEYDGTTVIALPEGDFIDFPYEFSIPAIPSGADPLFKFIHSASNPGAAGSILVDGVAIKTS